MEANRFITDLRDRILAGETASEADIYHLAELLPQYSEAIRQAAIVINKAFSPADFDSCSIVNARSGLCGENCKWCAQSRHYNGKCETYDLIDHDECLDTARYNNAQGIRRFSMVASGRAISGKPLSEICRMLKEVKETTDMHTCASLGLIGTDELQQLWNAGVKRYHCNLETAPSHFSTLCTTHSIDDKLATIDAARRIGFEICSGGIIGMGETMHQRAEFALKLREISPVSIPINILSPIPGTPLENQPKITEDEILDTIALFRFAHPNTRLRFAGGRQRLSQEAQLAALRIGINSGIVGDLLTTLGSTVAEDRKIINEAGYEF